MNDTSDTYASVISFAQDFPHESVSDAQIHQRSGFVQTLSCKPVTVVLGAVLCIAAMSTLAGNEPGVAEGLGQVRLVEQCSQDCSADQTLHFDVVVHVTLDAYSLEVLEAWTELKDIFIEGLPGSQFETEPGYSIPITGEDTV